MSTSREHNSLVCVYSSVCCYHSSPSVPSTCHCCKNNSLCFKDIDTIFFCCTGFSVKRHYTVLIVLNRRSAYKLCVAENGADVAISFLLKKIPQHTYYTSVIVLSNNYLHGLRNFLPPFFAMNKRKRLLTLTHGGCFFYIMSKVYS